MEEFVEWPWKLIGNRTMFHASTWPFRRRIQSTSNWTDIFQVQIQYVVKTRSVSYIEIRCEIYKSWHHSGPSSYTPSRHLQSYQKHINLAKIRELKWNTDSVHHFLHSFPLALFLTGVQILPIGHHPSSMSQQQFSFLFYTPESALLSVSRQPLVNYQSLISQTRSSTHVLETPNPFFQSLSQQWQYTTFLISTLQTPTDMLLAWETPMFTTGNG